MIIFTPWRNFCAYKDKAAIGLFLRAVAKDAETRLKEGIKNPPKTGRLYRRRGGRIHQASKNSSRAEFPANDYGRLLASVTSEVTPNSATIGTTVYYGKFLREGTKKMRRRRMSDDAMEEIVPRSLARLRGWVGWKRGK